MENDIDLDKVNQQYNNNFDTQQGNTYSTLPTLKAPTTKNNTLAATNQNSMTALKNNSKSTTEVPKSLQMLFEDNSEEQEDLAPPKAMSILWNEWNHQQLKSQTWTVFHNYPLHQQQIQPTTHN